MNIILSKEEINCSQNKRILILRLLKYDYVVLTLFDILNDSKIFIAYIRYSI